MSCSKHKKSGTQIPVVTRASTSIASKLSAMAANAAPANVNIEDANTSANVGLSEEMLLTQFPCHSWWPSW